MSDEFDNLAIDHSRYIPLGGLFYSFPFVSNSLIFRIPAIRRSVLVQHGRRHNTSMRRESDKTVIFSESRDEIDTAKVHIGENANMGLEELGSLKGTGFTFSSDVWELRDSGLAVRISPHRLLVRGMLKQVFFRGPRIVCPIRDSNYVVELLAGLEDPVPLAILHGAEDYLNSRFDCWRVSICLGKGAEELTISSEYDWSLTAADDIELANNLTLRRSLDKDRIVGIRSEPFR